MHPTHISPWYYGSPLALSSLRMGSTITQDIDLARACSHLPRQIYRGTDSEGRPKIIHDGQVRGYLYQIAEIIVESSDVRRCPLRAEGGYEEWITCRVLKLSLIEKTELPTQAIQPSLECMIVEHFAARPLAQTYNLAPNFP